MSFYFKALKENIIFGDEKNNFDEIHINNAVKLANLSELIDSLPDGLNTMVVKKGLIFLEDRYKE